MAYSLSFSPEFFLGEGEPYDRPDPCVNAKGQPTSVWTALGMMSDAEWAELAREVFDVEPNFLDRETVLQKIEETDTCGTLGVPVDVWIDPEGYFRVEVYDHD